MQEQQTPQQQALNLLIQALELAQKRGAYSLQEAATIAQAIAAFAPEQSPSTNQVAADEQHRQEGL
ncbi:hypothetical protein [Cesiribacter andamanensis]|uniref:Uncharacterized protein n=1 Tax=Cesiribacter andamanensis AMV16 TaxID=1279009 RepID=M7NAZ5_9BACT|nr:hypothetical protein [Cesiribacter andamanensis]EMR04442.1 hypothetical protein ADICEAN_00340 [Cesiribacter andamanensis AMV16]